MKLALVTRWRSLLAVGAVALAVGCDYAPVHAVLYENLALFPESGAADHFQQFTQINGGVVDLGCLVVQRRQINCYDTAGNGSPNLRLAVVECEYPCTAEETDPCDPTRPPVRSGVIRGLVDQQEDANVLGGVEIPSDIELSGADQLFITREPNDDPSPSPSTDILIRGALIRDGEVIRGNLTSPTIDPVQGTVTIVPVRDEVSI